MAITEVFGEFSTGIFVLFYFNKAIIKILQGAFILSLYKLFCNRQNATRAHALCDCSTS